MYTILSQVLCARVNDISIYYNNNSETVKVITYLYSIDISVYFTTPGRELVKIN